MAKGQELLSSGSDKIVFLLLTECLRIQAEEKHNVIDLCMGLTRASKSLTFELKIKLFSKKLSELSCFWSRTEIVHKLIRITEPPTILQTAISPKP